MNFDELTAVWKSQDTSPLHGVDEAQLRLALRQEEARVQKSRRRERWIIYGLTTLTVALLVRLLLIMIYRRDGQVLSGWDYGVPVVGGVAVLLWGRRMYMMQRVQATLEQRFGESLRDQINRQLAQCDYAATKTRPARRLDLRLLFLASMVAMAVARGRMKNLTFSDGRLWGPIVLLISVLLIGLGVISWRGSLVLKRKILPRKHRLEELLRQLDGQ